MFSPCTIFSAAGSITFSLTCSAASSATGARFSARNAASDAAANGAKGVPYKLFVKSSFITGNESQSLKAALLPIFCFI